MNIQILSDKSKTFETTVRNRSIKIGDITVKEHYTNGKLDKQVWGYVGGIEKRYSHEYDPNWMSFHFYEDISFLDSDKCTNYDEFWDTLPEPSFVTDLDNLNLDHILCIRLGIDGNIYRLTQVEPLPLWRRKDYIGSFTNKSYNLREVLNTLESIEWIRDPNIIRIPYYNQSDGETHAIEFDYKQPTKKHMARELKKIPLFADSYIGEV